MCLLNRCSTRVSLLYAKMPRGSFPTVHRATYAAPAMTTVPPDLRPVPLEYDFPFCLGSPATATFHRSRIRFDPSHSAEL